MTDSEVTEPAAPASAATELVEISVASNEANPEIDTNTKVEIFSAVVGFIYTDAQLIWSRYHSMLTANTFIGVLLGALLAKGDGLSNARDCILVVLTGTFGLSLTWEWKLLTTRGWELQNYWVEHANTFQWSGYKNPMSSYFRWCAETKCGLAGTDDWISVHAHRVIYLFIAGYLLAIAYGLVSLLLL